MSLTILNKTAERIIGARLFVPAPPEDVYEAVLDVRSFPAWAPGVRRVEIVEGPVGPGMVSEWEVSVLGLRRKISSILEEAEPPGYLRWSYAGPVWGWGECEISRSDRGALAEFRTELCPEDPALEKLARTTAARNAATAQLKRSLARLGHAISKDGGVRVGSVKDSC